MNDIPGVYRGGEGELLCVIIHDFHDVTLIMDAIYTPTREELENLFEKHDLPVEHCMDIIEKRNPDSHTFMFNLAQFRGYLKEQGLE